MNTQSIQGRKVEWGKLEKPGDFALSDDKTWLNIWLPGENEPGAIPISTGPKVTDKWHWDGNEEKPTIWPSIHRIGIWHGWFQAGFFKSC